MATALLEPAVQPRLEHKTEPCQADHRLFRFTLAVVLLGILWRGVRYLMQYPIWGDEAYLSLSFFERGFMDMTGRLDYNQVAPIGFLWTEWLAFHLLGPSELSLHLMPVLAGIAGLLLFWRFCRLTLPPAACSLAVCLLAVSYYPVRHATEIKPYSFDLLMAMALLLPCAPLLRHSLLDSSTPTPRVRSTSPWGLGRCLVLLTLIAPVAIGSSYPAVFVAGAVSLTLLPWVGRSRSWKAWGWYAAFNLVMAGTFLAHVKLVGGEQLDAKADTTLHNYWKDWFPPADPVRLLPWLLKAHSGAMMAYPVGSAHGGSTLTLLLCLAGLFVLLRGRYTSLAVLCLVPFALSLVAAFAGRYPYGGSARLAQHLAPAICILMALGIVQVITWFRRSPPTEFGRAEGLILAGLGVIALCGIVWSVYRPYKMPGDQQIRQLLREVAHRAQPTDTIVVFDHPDTLRANMIWYLRLTGLPIVWQGQADWSRLSAGRHGVWGFSVRGQEDARPTAAEMLGGHANEWNLLEQDERTFDADSKDVPLQKCQVFHWGGPR